MKPTLSSITRRLPLLAICLLCSFMAMAQKITVKGKVVDATTQKPVEGASIAVKNSSTGTRTDAEGLFSLEADAKSKLVISNVGYQPQQIAASTSFLVVAINAAPQQLNEVVVTALGVRKETKKIGYAVQEIKAQELLKAREPNPINGLVGKIAGLNVGISAELLGAPNVQLRGNNVSFYVVDGIPINSDTWNISPDDIESFTVLKGPAAAALYGSRGINGAIMITTKKAKKNTKGYTIEVNSSTQINSGFIAIPKVQNEYGGGDNAQYAFGDGKGGGLNDGDYDVWGPKLDGRLIPQYDSPVDPVTGIRSATPYLPRGKNNLDNFIQKGLLSINNINFSSASDRSNVRMSFTNTYQKGIFPNTKLNSINFNVFGSYDISKQFKVEASINYNRQFSPNVPDVTYGPKSYVYNIDIWTGADWDLNQMRNYWQPGKEGVQSFFAEYKRYHNPWFQSYEWLSGHYKNDLNAYLSLNYKITPHLEALVRSNVTTYNILRTEKLPFSAHPYGEEHNHGQYREDHRDLWENNTDVIVKYNDAAIGNTGIVINAFVGGNVRNMKYNSNFTTTTQLIVPNVYNFSNSLFPVRSSNFGANMIVLSSFASADVAFKKYFTVSGTLRQEKTSALLPYKANYLYPTVSASTVLTDYLRFPKLVNFFKVRGNYANVKGGQTTAYIGTIPVGGLGSFVGYGQDYVTPYDGPSYGLTRPYQLSPVYNNVTGAYAPSNIVDPTIQPFSRTNVEAGFDARLVHNRIGISATYFRYLNGPNQYSIPLSETSGASGFTTNAFKTRRTGAEISLQGTPVEQLNGLRWEVLVNWATYKEVYTDLPAGAVTRTVKEGDRVDNLYGSVSAKTPDGKVIHDASGLPVYLPKTQLLGHADPDFSWGINNKFAYKNFTFSFQFDGMVGGKIQDRVKRKLYEGGRGIETVQGAIGEARAYESAHWQDAGYTGAYYANGTPILGADGVQIANGVPIDFDPVTGVITNMSALKFKPNTVATKWVQDYVSSFYNDPEHTMVSKTYAKLREVIIGYSLPSKLFKNKFISRVDVSFVARNLLYFFPSAFKDIDVDQYPGRDIYNNSNREYDLQSPTTRSYGFNVNIVF